jgi:hypothetical protein
MIISTPETLITITPESPITIIGIHKEVKDFRVGPGGPAREQIKQAEHQDSAQESVQEVKDRGPHHKGEKEESPLRPQKGERVIERPENGITSSFHRRASKGITLNSALPTPKMTPAIVRFAPPSPNANINPPTTIATSAKPVAIGPVKAASRTCTACVQGDIQNLRQVKRVHFGGGGRDRVGRTMHARDA